jgi:manganese-dependent ADP-ribose/CDP-alcohol diphosphatase
MTKLPIISCALLVIGCGATMVERGKARSPFTFAVLADIQYADKRGGRRQYRKALEKLKECVEELNTRDLAFTIQLGDIIDGNKAPEKTLAELDSALEVYGKLSSPKYHVIGNHCLVAGREILLERLGLGNSYYEFFAPEAPGWRFVVLDGNDAGYGVVGDDQLRWLGAKLSEARAANEKVIVFSHFALLKKAARHRMKVPGPVLELITKSGCVVAYFAGHDHSGGYALQDGIHHVTVCGIVEAPTKNAYAVIEVHPNELKEIGFGKEPSRNLLIADPALVK